jgi:hypothetical protein
VFIVYILLFALACEILWELGGWFEIDHTVKPGPWTPEETARRNKALKQMGRL